MACFLFAHKEDFECNGVLFPTEKERKCLLASRECLSQGRQALPAHCPGTDTNCMATVELTPFKNYLPGHMFLS